jgi:uncharacterized phage protein (predicted DNA packaging)
MTDVTLSDLKSHLNITTSDDDALLTSKLAAAQAWILSFTGVADPMPEPLNEAVRQLAAHFYENREATIADAGVTPYAMPFSIMEMITLYRNWAF